jgi:hypothetical protein
MAQTGLTKWELLTAAAAAADKAVAGYSDGEQSLAYAEAAKAYAMIAEQVRP